MQSRTPISATTAKRKALSNLSINTDQNTGKNKIGNAKANEGQKTAMKRKRSCDVNTPHENDKLKLCYYTFDTPVDNFYAFVDKYPDSEGNGCALRACGWTTRESESKSKCQNISKDFKKDEQQSYYEKLLLPFYTHANIDEIDDCTEYDRTCTRASMSTIHKLYEYFHAGHELLLPPEKCENTNDSSAINKSSLSQTEKWNQSLDKLLDSISVQFPSQVSSYTRTVWEVLRHNVKTGQVLSYKALAELTCAECNRVQAQASENNKSGKQNTTLIQSKPSPRGVGRAMATNPVPIVIPCHRVLSSDMHLHGYGPGLHRKVWLLQHEHANVNSNMLSEFANDKRSY